jgi:transcriptional regulator with XRE-family HTH domain
MSQPNLRKIHIGRNIERIREIKGINQENLAAELGISQQAVSKMEQSEYVDNERLLNVAKILDVTVDAIKSFNEDAVINNLSCNFSDNAVNTLYQYNSVEKIIELYEKLLKEKDEMIELYKSQHKS